MSLHFLLSMFFLWYIFILSKPHYGATFRRGTYSLCGRMVHGRNCRSLPRLLRVTQLMDVLLFSNLAICECWPPDVQALEIRSVQAFQNLFLSLTRAHINWLSGGISEQMSALRICFDAPLCVCVWCLWRHKVFSSRVTRRPVHPFRRPVLCGWKATVAPCGDKRTPVTCIV